MERNEILERLPDLRPLIGGERQEGAGAMLPVEDPARGEVVAQVSRSSPADVESAVQAARTAFRSGEWPALDARDRGHLLTRLAGLVKEEAETLAALEALDTGKTFTAAREADISRVVETLAWFGGLADKIEGRTLPVRGGALSYTLPEPLGVVAALAPCDSPLLTAVRMLAPALIAGCTVILLPADPTPLGALALASLIEEAGFPAGTVNVLPGAHAEAGRALVAHPEVDAIVFAGSAAEARDIAARTAPTQARLALELGGGAANLVFADAGDPVELAARLGRAAFHDQGQGRIAARRILVQKELQPTLAARLVEVANGLRVGDPFDRRSDLGALVSAPRLASVVAAVEAARAAGATCIAGGSRASVPDLDGGHFMRPTVFMDVAPDSPLLGEEILGPVAVLIPFETADEAVALAGAHPSAAGIWTRDLARAHDVARRLRAPTVWINDYGRFDPAAPSGGRPAAALGGGARSIDFFTREKSVWIAPS